MRIVVANGSLVGYPEAGGLWSLFLQFLLALDALGHDVLWLELFTGSGQHERDERLIRAFFERMRFYGVDHRCAVLAYEKAAESQALENADIRGRHGSELRRFLSSADVLWNVCSGVRPPLLSLFRRRALIDLDPGHLQVSALEVDMRIEEHEALLTVGAKIHDPDCEIPTLGRRWHGFAPLVHLPMWSGARAPGRDAPFTSVTQWNCGELWLNDRVLSISKREAYMRYVELPSLTGQRFELAANMHSSDRARDGELLIRSGWRLVDPHVVAGSPDAYRHYIFDSRGELCCPKPIFRELRTGWISDRSAAYLAAGRPVLAEDTGFSDLPGVGQGLLAFSNPAEAANCVAAVNDAYTLHCEAAQQIAEDLFDARKVIPTMLDASLPGSPEKTSPVLPQ